MHPFDPRLARKIVCAAVAAPVLLVAGCSSGSDDGGDDKSTASPSGKPSPTVAPAKFEQLPDPCKSLPKDTVEDTVPNADNVKGKNLTSTDTQRYGSCLWSGGHGKNNANYRSLTVSLKRFESGPSVGSGDKQAQRYLKEEVSTVAADKDNKKATDEQVSGLGQEAVSIGYETAKKKQDYRVNRTVTRNYNVVVTIDYEGTGFEGADQPSADDLRKKAAKAAKETLATVK
ncbi:DUF3558 family protein [Streptomyces sp. N2-109]|uniref:DUF3558 family protein n=1 Tax=Streptomyces gossypii TaxID=2883101 RepID=A0ABT2JXL2_9ACTN|nr:DUF3558 family protein [Streptomyces gossypii]MCT2592075.1 DUF3558 family protein [Streptomyces gossypii]